MILKKTFGIENLKMALVPDVDGNELNLKFWAVKIIYWERSPDERTQFQLKLFKNKKLAIAHLEVMVDKIRPVAEYYLDHWRKGDFHISAFPDRMLEILNSEERYSHDDEIITDIIDYSMFHPEIVELKMDLESNSPVDIVV